jgi:hypothetical protein
MRVPKKPPQPLLTILDACVERHGPGQSAQGDPTVRPSCPPPQDDRGHRHNGYVQYQPLPRIRRQSPDRVHDLSDEGCLLFRESPPAPLFLLLGPPATRGRTLPPAPRRFPCGVFFAPRVVFEYSSPCGTPCVSGRQPVCLATRGVPQSFRLAIFLQDAQRRVSPLQGSSDRGNAYLGRWPRLKSHAPLALRKCPTENLGGGKREILLEL